MKRFLRSGLSQLVSVWVAFVVLVAVVVVVVSAAVAFVMVAVLLALTLYGVVAVWRRRK